MESEGGTRSEAWAARLERVIPWGSSTCSKKPRYLPEEPGVIVRGRGCRVWDADDREFIDFRLGLGPVTLGYGHPVVDEAIRAQLENGIVFGHPHPLEGEVAELLAEAIPCAEQVRFLKTGGEAVAACIRLARAYTGRERVVQIGYNGWLNALAPSGRVTPGFPVNGMPPGVPQALAGLHHACAWNDRAAVERVFTEYPGEIACVVVAAAYADMAAGAEFYPFLRHLTSRYGALLIYDEIVTGFRVAVGGVQEYFGVLPDLAVFSKGIANGMPLAAYLGQREVMQGLERVVVSSTFAGETLSLAAARAVLRTYRAEDVAGHLWRQGEAMWTGLNTLFRRHELPAVVQGFWPCPQIRFSGPDATTVRERFFRAAYRHGVSLYDVPYVSFSHREPDIAEALERLDRACREVTSPARTAP
jgi:glutamate-1-semialdehyde 2,1-aminomutase